MLDIYKFLEDNKIAYQRFDHSAVFTCEEADLLDIEIPGVSTKNLFLRDKNGKRHFLVTVDKDKQVDFGKLKEILEVSKLSFGSPERLQKYLGLTPGSVTLLGVINDSDGVVEVIIDEEIWGQTLQCHPLINTASLVIEHEEIKRFLDAARHSPRIISISAKIV